MPVFFYGLLTILFLISIRLKKNDGFLDRESSNVIKGFFILLIVFSHIMNSFPYGGCMEMPLRLFRGILRQLCVSMFFFISGYGIIYSVESKGELYSKSLFTNRFLRILIYSIIGLIPFIIYNACLGQDYSLGEVFLNMFGLSFSGIFNWFLFAILVCYLLSSIVYIFNWNNRYVPALLVSIGVIAYIFVMYFLKQAYITWDTIVCFVYGIFVALFRGKINSFLGKKKYIPHTLMVISIVIVTGLQSVIISRYGQYLPEIIEMWFANLFFCLFFVCLTKVFTLKSAILSFLGKASFGIFMMHGLLIRCFVDIGTIPIEWLNYLVLFITAPLVGIPVYYVYKIVDKYITDPIVRWNRNLVTNNSEKQV